MLVDHFLLISLLVLLSATTLSLIVTRQLIIVSLLMSFISVFFTIIYIILDAIDVAITEAAVGSGVSTILLLAIIYLTKSYKISIAQYKILSFNGILSIISLIAFLLILISVLPFTPIFGDANNPAHITNIYKVYTQASYETFGISNAVTMILGSFRGFDTLGETTVVFIASLGVYILMQTLLSVNLSKSFLKTIHLNENNESRIIQSAILLLISVMLLFGLYIQFHGDYGPGGGFQAGVVVASAYFMLLLSAPNSAINMILKEDMIVKILSLGVLIYILTGISSMIFGNKFLDYAIFSTDIKSAYHTGLFCIELGVGATVFAAMTIIMSKFYKLINNSL